MRGIWRAKDQRAEQQRQQWETVKLRASRATAVCSDCDEVRAGVDDVQAFVAEHAGSGHHVTVWETAKTEHNPPGGS